MKRYQKITEHKDFLHYINRIKEVEKERIFCRHGIEHLMDVARIAYIMNLEEGLGFSRELVYGAALLHDIGKVKQYEAKIPHEKTGEEAARRILPECGYDWQETELVARAILYHRKGDDPHGDPLSRILYEADKASRQCMFCQAMKECNWKENQKNKTVMY